MRVRSREKQTPKLGFEVGIVDNDAIHGIDQNHKQKSPWRTCATPRITKKL